MKTLRERLAHALAQSGMNQSELARRVGVSRGAVSLWLNTDSEMTAVNNARAAEALDVDPQWLATGRGSPTTTQIKGFPPEPDDRSIVTIRQYDTGGKMGNGGVQLRDQPGVIESWRVSREWVEQNVRGYASVDKLCLVTGFGDSMKPMFNPGDPLIVDASVKTVEFDAVYFFRVGDEGFIKRLQRIPGQGLVAISENNAYRDWVIDKTMDFEVFGRVLKVWRSEEF